MIFHMDESDKVCFNMQTWPCTKDPYLYNSVEMAHKVLARNLPLPRNVVQQDAFNILVLLEDVALLFDNAELDIAVQSPLF